MWLGIDVGTGGTRALIVDERGKIRAGVTAPHEEIRMERPLWAEQRPDDWWQAALGAIRGALAEANISGRDVQESASRARCMAWLFLIATIT